VGILPGFLCITRKTSLVRSLRTVYGDACAFTILPRTFKLPEELDDWAGRSVRLFVFLCFMCVCVCVLVAVSCFFAADVKLCFTFESRTFKLPEDLDELSWAGVMAGDVSGCGLLCGACPGCGCESRLLGVMYGSVDQRCLLSTLFELVAK
jgi:hypothetical protein